MEKEQERNQHDQPEKQQFDLSGVHNLKFTFPAVCPNEAFTLTKAHILKDRQFNDRQSKDRQSKDRQ